jgi:hypothetical protein
MNAGVNSSAAPETCAKRRRDVANICELPSVAMGVSFVVISALRCKSLIVSKIVGVAPTTPRGWDQGKPSRCVRRPPGSEREGRRSEECA